MKAFVERIEDGGVVVLAVPQAGILRLPKKLFPFKVYEGMHVTLQIKPDPGSQAETLNRVRALQSELLKRSRQP